MKKILSILSVAAVLTWGIAFLYFYGSGRIDKYLDPSFRIYALLAGIGMLLLGAFNFINRNRDVGACTHDHGDGESCSHDHSHDHGCCGHEDHKHDHKHDDGGCCGHDHDEHHHDHSGGDHHHDHEETVPALAFAIAVLVIPLFAATAYSKDRFSNTYVNKWGTIERQMMQMRAKEKHAAQTASVAKVGGSETKSVTNPYTSDAIDNATPGDADTPPAAKAEAGTGASEAPAEAGSNDSWSSFTMDDLKNLVPQSSAGDFLLDVPQIFYTAGDKELMHVMEGIPVETTAQLMEETLHNPDGNRLKAFRLFIECCAADARPLSIPVEFADGLPEYKEMGWYKLFGKLHYLHDEDGIVPILKIDHVESTVEPVDGLLF